MILILSFFLIADEVEVGFSPQQYTVREGINSNVTVCVSLSGPLERDGVIVRVATADMTALSKPSFCLHTLTFALTYSHDLLVIGSQLYQ